MSLFNSKENAILDYLFGSGSPATYNLALSTTAPNDDGTNITEPVGNNYSRITVTNNVTNFPSASGGIKTNGATFNFPQSSGAWGTIGWWVVYDSTTPILWGTVSPSKVVGAGKIFSIPSGQMTITCD